MSPIDKPPTPGIAIRFKRFLFQALIFLGSLSAGVWDTYTYLWTQAEPFTPTEGTVFPREPVLVGTYQFINGPGGRNFITKVGDTQILCSSFSYYSATWFDPGAYFDCDRKKELDGKSVEVHRVRLPAKRDEPSVRVIKIVSEGRVYLDLSDAQIREKWIKDTEQAGWFSGGLIILLVPLAGIIAWFGRNWSEKIFR